jgi:GTP-binding protein Era
MRSGLIAVVGKPNAGKSTLINQLTGKKVSIVSPRPQTTRRCIQTAFCSPEAQYWLIDTPGIQRPKNLLGKMMLLSAESALASADVALLVVDVSRLPTEEDQRIVHLIKQSGVPKTVVALNKMDLLPIHRVPEHYSAYEQLVAPAPMMYTNALKGHNLNKLIQLLQEALPEEREPVLEAPSGDSPPSPENLPLNLTLQEYAAEIIREKALHYTRQEVPHSLAVIVEHWEDPKEGDPDPLTRIYAQIIVERPSQKPILIGKQGSMIKRIGSSARQELEKILRTRVFLKLHVTVREGWTDHPWQLREFGYVP